MVCPVCIIDGALISGCKVLGIPDPITFTLIGSLTTVVALQLEKKVREKYDTASYKYLFIILFLIITILFYIPLDVIKI
jgi:hypothetical protein